MFKGAGGRSARDIVEVIESAGGQINAATGYERTSFQVRCLTGNLPLAMSVLADLVRRPAMAEADLQQEKSVIGQEIAEAADAPDDKVFDLAQAQAFPGPGAWPPDPRHGGEHRPSATPASLGAAYHQKALQPRSNRGVGGGRSGRRRSSGARRDGLRRYATRSLGASRPSRGVSWVAPRRRRASWSRPTSSCFWKASALRTPTTSRCACSRRSWAEAWPPACSKSCASKWDWPTPSTPIAKAMRTLAYSAFTPAAPPAMQPLAARVAADQISALAEAPTSGRTRPREGPAEGALVHGPRIAPRPCRTGRRPPAPVRPPAHTPEALSADIDATTLKDLRRVGGGLLNSAPHRDGGTRDPSAPRAALQAFAPTAKAA